MERSSRRTGLGAAGTLAAVLACTPSAGNEPPALSVETARKLIAELGPQKAAERVASDSPQLEAVASGVAGGRLEWLDVGVQLVGTDEAYLKDRLLQAFSNALQHDAAAVLERGAAGVPLGAVCGYDPFTGVDNPGTLGQFNQALASRERAVARIRRADLAAAKSTCLTALTHLKAVGASRYAP